MTHLPELQRRFLRYLQNADDTIAADIAADTKSDGHRRLSIYYNAYRSRFRDSIETDHPVLGVYLGDRMFEKLVAGYIAAYPSSETSLRHFCDSLPVFLRKDETFSQIGVVAQLATFERLLMDVFDAADGEVQSIDSLSSLPAERWPEYIPRFHPSVRTYVTEWNDVEIWQAIKVERTPPDAVQSDYRAWLLWRNQERLTEFRSLAVDEYTVLDLALRGGTFAELCESFLEWHTESEVAERALKLLQGWFSAGLIVEGSVRYPRI